MCERPGPGPPGRVLSFSSGKMPGLRLRSRGESANTAALTAPRAQAVVRVSLQRQCCRPNKSLDAYRRSKINAVPSNSAAHKRHGLEQADAFGQRPNSALCVGLLDAALAFVSQAQLASNLKVLFWRRPASGSTVLVRQPSSTYMYVQECYRQ